MRTNTTVHRLLAMLLAFCLTVPSAAVTAMADGKSGKKSYKEGLKYEELQQWDLAAQEFAMAVAAEPTNYEYKLHYARSLQNASIMFVKRGDELAKQGDYASAYNAYRQAIGYDQGNEMASMKMRSMLELQKEQATGLNQSVYDPQTGRIKPISTDIQFQTKPRNRETQVDLKLDDDLKTVIKTLSRQLDLNVIFDESVRAQGKVNIELHGVTLAKAFDLVLLQNKLTFQQVDRKTILVYMNNQQTRLLFEQAALKTFYLGNIKMTDARAVVNTLLPGKPVAAIEDQKVIILKGTPSELQLLQDVLDSVDKNISEVIIDVEIYEVSNDTKLRIGNQLATEKGLPVLSSYTDKTTGEPKTYVAGETASLTNLGGLFAKGALALAGTTFNPLNGVGGLIGLPGTTLSLLQSKGNSKLLNKIQIHALDGQSNTTKVGRSVPVSLGSNYGAGVGTFGGIGGVGGVGGVGTPGGTVGGVNQGLGGGLLGGLGGGGYGGGLFNSIQYKDVGLVINAKPKITNEGYVEITMKIETSNVEAGADPLTPNFTQRSLDTTARIQDGVTSIVASVTQDSKGNSRTSIPFIGMLPLLGRLFTTPNQESRQSDIVITVTPHIIRAAEITKEDNLAKLAGLNNQSGAGSGLLPSIEDVLFRAQLEEEQERRLVASERGGVPADPTATTALTQTPAQIAPTTAPNAVPLRNASNSGGGLPDKGLPAGPSGAANTFQPANNTGSQPRKNISITGGGGDSSGSNASSTHNWNPQPVTADTNPPPEINPALIPQVTPPVEINPASNTGLNPALNPNLPPNANPNVQPNAAGDDKATGEKSPEAAGQVVVLTPDGVPVRPAQVMNATRPPELEKYLQEQRLLAAKERAAAANNKKQPAAQPPIDYVPPTQPQRVNAPPAAPKGAGRSAAGGDPGSFNNTGAPEPVRLTTPKAGSVALSLQPQQSRVQLGKTVMVTLQLDSQTALSSANLALRFDPLKLQVKAVRDGDMLGKQPDIMHSTDMDVGRLNITANATGGKAIKPSGRLIVIEFLAINPGESEISVDGGQTQVRLAGNVMANLNATAAQVVVTR